ncbi:prostatic acid phosphatase isoform X2 [Zootermopsis nevadensis]|uniref:prostatic acid phosphatase isoform X2 n=1 Tax=Zootermopsis nevadensis TaxID=136037 RepID=UPI000B8E5A21|nr:prostatic acid phosphatase isoform X2 [Zootermopsis nevadensis]
MANFLFSVAFGMIMLERTSWYFFVSSLSEDTSSLGSLVFVSALYRHGDRTPVSSYPTDPYNNLSYWPVGWGQLTNIGKNQHYELGQWLRKRYSDVLPKMYSREDIYVRSTDVDRTLMSAASNLAGLYPPEGDQKWNKNIDWQPIPVHTVPESMDEILAGKRPCASYDAELLRVKTSPEMRRYNEEHADLYRYTSEQSGSNIHDPESLEFLCNTLFIEELYNLTLPNWTKSVYPQKMMSVSSYSFTVPAKTRLLQRLKIGPLVRQVIRHMMEKRDGTMKPDYKMTMYSAHDTTVANFLMALGIFDEQSPPYRSLVLVELWKNDQAEYQVKVLYRNSTTHDPYNLAIPGCASVCPLEKFADLLKPVIPVSWEKECKMGIFSDDFTFNSLAIIVVFGIAFWRKQKVSSNYYYHQLQQDVS